MATGLPDSVPAWYTGPSGASWLHHVARAAEGRQRHAAADHLAEHAQVRREAGDGLRVQALRAAEGDAEAGHHLVEDEQRAVLAAQLAQAAHEGHGGAHEVHVAGDRLDDHAGEFGAVQREGLLELRDVVVLEHQRVLHHLRGTPALVGWPKVASPEPALTSSASAWPW